MGAGHVKITNVIIVEERHPGPFPGLKSRHLLEYLTDEFVLALDCPGSVFTVYSFDHGRAMTEGENLCPSGNQGDER